MVEFMDLAHDGENNNNDSLEICTPDDVFCVRFSPELQKWSEVDGKSGNSRQMLTLFDFMKDFCKQVRSSKNYLLERMHNDQWLHSKITLQNRSGQDHLAIHVAIASKPQGEVLEQLPVDSTEVMGSPNSSSKEDMNVTVQSNILPRQALLEKLRSVTTSQYAKYLSLSWLLGDAGVAGTVGLGSLVYKVATERKDRGMCELIKQLSIPSLEVTNDVKLPNIPPQTVTSDEKIATGTTAEVWKVIISQGVFVKKEFKDECRSLTSMETQIVEMLSHPHIVHTFGCIVSNDRTSTKSSLLMEFMEHDLRDWLLQQEPRQPLELQQHVDALDVLLQVAKAMKYLHGMNVVHGDIKPDNILISKFNICDDGGPFIIVKVADFGSAQALTNSNREHFKPSEGTTKWAAPEVLRSTRKNKNSSITENDIYLEDPLKVDVYSFGITAFEVLTGLGLFEGEIMKNLVEKIKCHNKKLAHDFSKKFTDATKDYPEFFISFIQRCWAYDPEKRPSFHEIIEEIEKAKGLMKPGISEPHECRVLEIQEAKNLSVMTRSSKPSIREKLIKKYLGRKNLKTRSSKLGIREKLVKKYLGKKNVKTRSSKLSGTNKLLEKLTKAWGQAQEKFFGRKNLKTWSSKLNLREKLVKKFPKGLKRAKKKYVEMKNTAVSKSTANQVWSHPMESNSPTGTSVKTSSPKAKTSKRKREGNTWRDGLKRLVKGN